MAKDQRKNFEKNRKELIRKINASKEDFRKKAKVIRTDLDLANKIWNEMHENLKKRGQQND